MWNIQFSRLLIFRQLSLFSLAIRLVVMAYLRLYCEHEQSYLCLTTIGIANYNVTQSKIRNFKFDRDTVQARGSQINTIHYTCATQFNLVTRVQFNVCVFERQ